MFVYIRNLRHAACSHILYKITSLNDYGFNSSCGNAHIGEDDAEQLLERCFKRIPDPHHHPHRVKIALICLTKHTGIEALFTYEKVIKEQQGVALLLYSAPCIMLLLRVFKIKQEISVFMSLAHLGIYMSLVGAWCNFGAVLVSVS